VTGHSYLDMLENFAVPQIPSGFIFQQDGAPPHFHRDVTTCIKIFLVTLYTVGNINLIKLLGTKI
jgi:hypothetical protein